MPHYIEISQHIDQCTPLGFVLSTVHGRMATFTAAASKWEGQEATGGAGTLQPVSSSSWALEEMTTTSSPSSLAQMGNGVPQKRLRLIAQSFASCNTGQVRP